MKKIPIVYIGVIISVLVESSLVFSKNIYVDNTLSQNCTSNNYSIANRNCSGSDGNAYTTVQAAINAMNGGDDIFVRGGVYQEGLISIPLNKNGTNDNWSSIQSYGNEWAVLDGNHQCDNYGGSVIGHPSSDYGSSDLKYWLFERLEIKNGRNPGNTVASGFWINGGPFIIRFCYIHDNYCNGGGNNPTGIKGLGIHDSIIEYCYFDVNGVAPNQWDTNGAHIAFYSDYDDDRVSRDGFSLNSSRSYRNTVRYNLMTNACVGFKYKSEQLLSGRNPAGGHGYDDTYSDYGDKIHHNIIINTRVFGISAAQDFIQVYNNIVEVPNASTSKGIVVNFEPRPNLYKTCIYNNTIVNANQFGIAHYKSDNPPSYHPLDYYGYDYNNLIDNSGSAGHGIMVVQSNSSYYGTETFDVSEYYNSNNYYYRPPRSSLFLENVTSYTLQQFLSQTKTHAPRIAYSNSYNSNNLLYVGTTNADKYKVRGGHLIEGSTTIANGGIGGTHPYLPNTTIPSYIGAVDPNDSEWVDIVFDLINLPTSGGSSLPDTPPKPRIKPAD